MNENVKKFIDAAKAAERKRFESERDSLLLSLGLIDPEKTRREYSDYPYPTDTHPDLDEEKKKYYRTIVEPLEVSDEEYEQIKQYAPKETLSVVSGNSVLGKTSENFLALLSNISLAIGTIVSIVLLFSTNNFGGNKGYVVLTAVGLFFISLMSWAAIKVLLNISNNLHEINSKIKL